ncbi:MAG: hypothetical protein N0C84_08935 [Candidatus Thiodiazotropha taylori]|uniref:Uncharacterized protein n=1 Tax=Candidatus Thiodiazotropha taylori TaxID=2792791 RepID=A0A9E4N4P8_9GAMM|nr:hypothetical protein [Candidatus Thiodiazotropha taylori]MCG7966772.1 hypothetical protein [Candidatus Thiodiazotropha taylori]MCW4256571.1 hypothetical protein [Candidatus Thiodiazotropha taylori]
MKLLTLALLLLLASPSFSCPFHGFFLVGDDGFESAPNASIGNAKGENSISATGIKPKSFSKFINFKTLSKQSSFGTSPTPEVEKAKPEKSLQ